MQDLTDPNQPVLPQFPRGAFYINYYDAITRTRFYRRESRRLPRLVLRRLARPRDLPVVRRLLMGLILESNQGRSPGSQ
jgi:hypothetical protein